jgi:AcrR family transcriptional regulator
MAFEASAPAGDFVGSIRQVIFALMRHGRCGLNEVADAVGMHPRTLQRRFSEAQEDYSSVLAQVRFETALRLLDDPRITLTDIAFETIPKVHDRPWRPPPILRRRASGWIPGDEIVCLPRRTLTKRRRIMKAAFGMFAALTTRVPESLSEASKRLLRRPTVPALNRSRP